jgi:hypothetical protein
MRQAAGAVKGDAMIRMLAIGLFALGALSATQSTAHPLTLAECTEGGEFVRNAALARDNGVTREFFVGKLAEDLSLIKAFPPQLRWFVQDAGDEKLLTQAVLKVFDAPLKAEQHEASFVGACIATTAYVDEDSI